jgi:hypothetical protein
MRKDDKLIGAAMERKAILRRVRSQIKARQNGDSSPHYDLERLEAWILDRDKRYQSRPGGLGRAKK